MKEKLQDSIAQSKNTLMNTNNEDLYFNMHIITKVYFGCGIIIISDKWEQILTNTHKPTIISKLGLSQQFVFEILCTRKEVLSIRLLKLSIIIVILATKLYIGYKRMNQQLTNIIGIHKEKAEI